MKKLVALVVLFLALPTLAMEEMVKQPFNRCVLVKTQEATATGVIVYSNLVLTNYHVIEDNTPVTVNGKSGLVVKRDRKHDMALILTDTPAFEWIEFCDAEIGDEVFYVGHPMAHPTKFVVPGVIAGVEDFDMMGNKIQKCLFSTNQGLPGFSGSGLYCKHHSRLVGLEFATNGGLPHGYLFSVAIPARQIKKFLERDKK